MFMLIKNVLHHLSKTLALPSGEDVSTYPILLPPLGNPVKCHEEVFSLQPMIPPTKRFDIFSP